MIALEVPEVIQIWEQAQEECRCPVDPIVLTLECQDLVHQDLFKANKAGQEISDLA